MKPVFASQTMSFGMTPDAVDDAAWTGLNQTVTIQVLNNDVPMMGGPLTIIDVSGETRGDATSPDGTSITYTPNSNFTSGSDTFQYTVRNPMGFTDTAFVTVTMVNVTGYTVEWKDSDGQWNASPPGEVLWSHEELRWHIATNLTNPLPQGVEVRKQDWDQFMQGGTTWTPFAFGTGVAQGNPGTGIWALKPSATYGAFGDQTGFVATMTTAAIQAGGAKPTVQIQSINWVAHSVPADAATLDIEPDGDVRFYPDATAPGGNARMKVDLEIVVTPQIANVTLYLKWFDVDDPTDHDGPIDLDPPDNVTNTNNADNFQTGAGLDPMVDLSFPTSATTNNLGRIRETFQINWIQPGNNFRIAAGPREQDILHTHAFAKDIQSKLFFDDNRDGFYDGFVGGPPIILDQIIDDGSPAWGIHTTPPLIVWRNLRLEVDSMGIVLDNKVDDNTVTNVLDNGDGTSTVTLANPLDDDDANQNRFQGGSLASFGNDFEIVSNGDTTIIVKNHVGAGAPTVQEGITVIRDDDEWQDGMDVPNPDISEVQAAFEQAFITALMVDPAENPNPTVSFRQHLESGADAAEIIRRDTAGQNSTAYWIAYLLAAFQGPKNRDNDFDDEVTVVEPGTPPKESAIMGVTPLPLGIAIVYMETNRDVAREGGVNVALTEQDTVVHELGHLVGNSSDEPV
jgi:hypothetical protein